jgi:hypothetical protein
MRANTSQYPKYRLHKKWGFNKAALNKVRQQEKAFVIGGSQIFELTKKDWESITALSNWAIKEFNIPGGGLTMRFGETVYTGATVCHLHAHLISPELNPKTGHAYTVEFPIG